MALHVERKGTQTICGRRMKITDRIVIRNDHRSYLIACQAMGRRNCLSCSDRLWDKARQIARQNQHSGGEK